jgi:hypothetical protein
MRAVWNALIEFQEEIQGENLLIRCDNATVVAYINKQGGTKSIPLCLLLWDMMQWCLKHNIHIHAAHIPGKKNCLADKLSRGQKLVRLTEWALKPSIVPETTGRVILVVLEEHPLLTPEVEETKTDVELRALPEELSNSLV